MTLSKVPEEQAAEVGRLVAQRAELLDQIKALTTVPVVYAGKFEQPRVTPLYYQAEDWVISTWWRKQ